MKEKLLHKVLLVDDDEVTNFLNEDIIKEMGFTDKVTVARNGKEALNFIDEWSLSSAPTESAVELILLDINMPVMDGFEFLQNFCALPARQHAKIVILTTSDNYRDVERADQYNIEGYINKPLTQEKISKMLEELFSNSLKLSDNNPIKATNISMSI